MPPRVFISHAPQDHGYAKQICQRLEETGIDCWIASRDTGTDEPYTQAITVAIDAIDACEAFLIVYSEQARESFKVSNEVRTAASKKKLLFPILIDDADPHRSKQFGSLLDGHPSFDASMGDFETHLPRIASDVLSVLHHRQDRVVPGRSTRHRATTAEISAHSGYARSGVSIGIDVGATKLRGCVVDLPKLDGGDWHVEEYFDEIDQPANAGTVLSATRVFAKRILDLHSSESVVGIGIAVPGQVDPRAGTLKFGPNLFGAHNMSFRTSLAQAFADIPIRVDNEVRCATRCELHLGIGSDFDDFVCIFIGSGVGSGAVINKSVYFGSNYCAGEIGHTKISPTGQQCVCGQVGCLETFVKAKVIVEKAEAKITELAKEGQHTLLTEAPVLDTKAVANAAERGDAAAQEVIEDAARMLGLGIANYLNIVNPQAVVMGGGIMAGFFFQMIDGMTRAVRENALPEAANTPIIQSAHPEDGGAIGAALLFHPQDNWPF